MRLLKPTWVSHDGQPIFSVDIHPDGTRFATGGQGNDAGKIIIWNMGPVRDEKEEKDEDVPKSLCQMDNHLACVNCVRWSRDGKYLASGGDDKLVMIWQTSRYGVGSTVFGSDSKIVESWRPVHTLRGHSGDVLDLAWSSGDVWLASCSIDNTIVIWNGEKFPEQVAVLKGHSGLVKGVTWDPVGKYIASQSDDKSLRVWRTRDWQMEANITEPFQECGGTTHVLRLDWSPDGNYIVSAHAMNNSGPTAQIIERQEWKATLDFVGHRKAVTVVRFNPMILSKCLKKDGGKPQQYSCCAIGSRDRSLSIWLTALKRPLVVTHDLFKNSILDISWSSSGMELLTCSCDGTVAYLDFTPEELGTPMPKKEVNQNLEKIYGKCLLESNKNKTTNQIIESAALLNLRMKNNEEKNQTPEKLPAVPIKPASNSSTSDTPFKPTNKQIETKTADGRRRITPIFLSFQPDVAEAPMPYLAKKIQFTSSSESSKIVVEKLDRVTGPGLTSPSHSQHNTPVPESTAKSSSNVVTPKASSSTISGESKVTPSVPVSPVGERSIPFVQPMTAIDNKSQQGEVGKEGRLSHQQETPKTTASTPDRHSDKDYDKGKSKLSLKRKSGPDGQPRKRGRPRLKDREPHSGYSSVATTPVVPPSFVERETVCYMPASSELQLPVLDIDKTYSKQIPGKTGTVSILLEVENNIKVKEMTFHKFHCSKGGNHIWEQVLVSKIIAVAGSSHMACVACEDSSIGVYNTSGIRLLPSLIMDSKVTVFEVTGFHLMAVTKKGNLFLWNMKSKTASIKNESLTAIMTGEDKLVKSRLTPEGVPIFTLSTNRSYSFLPDMACWTMLYDQADPLQHCSDHHSSIPKGSIKVSGPLASLQSSQERPHHQSGRLLQSGHSLQQVSTVSYLESQVSASLFLKSPAEYKFWITTYVHYLIKEGMETKLREICNDLLGPVYKTLGSSGSTTWQEWILGLNKRDLLREILPLMATNLSLQRLYTEYHDQLESVT
ncbi:hypothetical protein CHS0354_025378 [Potamilus streckersoni]|uniref:Protein HIRA n=1 Tax=Potamilus streckersoni TaxID=2493646 RepID=A0AAE0SPN6_9BIVA|nr:hypothetical protein CHS0354_025378 [Potamilus streckersoni]